MSNHDRAGQSAEDWKKRQDSRIGEKDLQFLANLKELQDKTKPTDLNDALADLSHYANNLLNYAGANPAEPQLTAGVTHHRDDHHDVVISADHLAGDLGLAAAIAAAVLVQQLNESLKNVNDLINSPLGEQSIDAIRASIAEVWDQFKVGSEQVIEDVKQRMTELLSPEKTQDQAPIEQHAPDTSVEIGGPKVEAEIAEIRKLQDEQEKVRADQAVKMNELRDQLAEKYEGSPDQEKYLKQFDKAAEVASETLDRQQDAEVQRLQEQQLQRTNPSDPSRDM